MRYKGGFKNVDDLVDVLRKNIEEVTMCESLGEPKRFRLIPKDSIQKGYRITPIFDENFNLIDCRIDRIN
jgi:hypothetical protein